jgi:hypothetical protein
VPDAGNHGVIPGVTCTSRPHFAAPR